MPTGASMPFFAWGVEEAASGRKITVLTEQVTTSEGLAPAFERLKERIADESSLPFSYLNRRSQPIGYSIDLCREIVEDVSTELDGMETRIAFAPVTPANRLQKVASGEIDLECGSTTANTERRREVAFSPTFFIAGTKLMVPKPPRR